MLFKAMKQNAFTPDFNKDEYSNWIDFIGNGGTDDEWKSLVKENGWEFKEDKFVQYQKKIKPINDKYFSQMHEIEQDWSMLFKSKVYVGENADKLEHKCKNNIDLYKKIKKIDSDYGHTSPENVPAFKRLAMLYEKQGQYEMSISVCVDALKQGAWGCGMQNRLARMIKKAKRNPTSVEMNLINDSRLAIPKDDSVATGRHVIPASEIDKMQNIEASEDYKKKIYNLYYSDYPEKPFVSQDRELNTNWIEQSMMFPEHSIIPKSMMRRYSDGLLPGHIYMLYWIDKIHRKRIPVYFEYEFGINFEKEKFFLIDNGYLNDTGKLTEKGIQAISKHYAVIEHKK